MFKATIPIPKDWKQEDTNDPKYLGLNGIPFVIVHRDMGHTLPFSF